MSSAQPQIFVTARVFDIMQFDNMLQKCFAVFAVARHYQRELWKLLPIEHLPAQSQQ